MKVKKMEVEKQGLYREDIIITLEKNEKLAVYQAIIYPKGQLGARFNDVWVRVIKKMGDRLDAVFHKELKWDQISNLVPTKVKVYMEYSEPAEYILQFIFYNETKNSIATKASWDWEWNVQRTGSGGGVKPIEPPKGFFDQLTESIKQLVLVVLVLVGVWMAITLKVPQKIAEALKRKGG